MKCLCIVLNSFTHDSRVVRQCGTLVRNGFDVHVFALHEGGLAIQEKQDGVTVRRFTLITRGWPRRSVVQLVKYWECMVRMVCAALEIEPALVHANDLIGLPIGYAIARLTGAKLLYDAHELWSDGSHRIRGPQWLFKIGVRVETWLARRADAVITVSESIALHMARTMEIPRPTVVRNLPSRQNDKHGERNAWHPLRESLGIANNVPIVLYQGAMAPGRGLEMLVDAMQWVTPRAVVVFLGDGSREYLDAVRSRAREFGVGHRIVFHPAVRADILWRYTADGTIGVCPIQGTCLSYKYCLPNKLFEYLQAGLPVVVSDLPEMAVIVRQYGVGETFPDGVAEELAGRLNGLLVDAGKLAQYRQNAGRAAKELHWGREESELISVYRRALGGSR